MSFTHTLGRSFGNRLSTALRPLRPVHPILPVHPVLRPVLRPLRPPCSYTSAMMASTLPRLPVFEAIARHDPDSTVVIHSNSGRRFRYGELLGDVCKVRNRLYETAGRDDLNGERVAFLVENSYDYVGKPATALPRVPSHLVLIPAATDLTYRPK